MEIAPDSLLESVPDSIASQEVPDSIVLDSEMVPDFVATDSEMVPETLPPGAFLCPRCHRVHENRESWDRAHSLFWPCSRCGLVHREYRIGAWLYDQDEFDCELFIPDLNNLVMRGNSIVLPEHVINMLNELAAAKADAKAAAAVKEDDAKAAAIAKEDDAKPIVR
jgi:predicted RNA-binding Zn-ribbon protein involved in translation (DUF1610 family)